MSAENRLAIVDLAEIDGAQAALAGGKGAQLGALMRTRGVDVPAGFVVTTDAYRRALASAPAVDALLDRLARLGPHDGTALGELSAQLRTAVGQVTIPADVAHAIAVALAGLGDAGAYAVRSSATAEDSAAASFAGQHDTFLNVVGADDVLERVRRCWASLFTEQAVAYRMREGFDHRAVAMAVVVQRMVPAQVAGVLFTADPISGNRTVASIEATAGLGEALVSGLVTPDRFRVRAGAVEEREPVGACPVLSDEQVLRLAALGRHIEAAAGCPQDIEWCLADGGFWVVQSRPITTLFPLPDPGDDDRHVYVSVGHQQMMTDPMKPLGISIWQMTARPRMYEAAGRMFVDVADRLASPATRDAVFDALSKSDPLIGSALATVIERGFVAQQEEPVPGLLPPGGPPPAAPLPTDPAIVSELIANTDATVTALRRDIAGICGPAVFDFVAGHIERMKTETFDPRSLQVVMAGFEAAWWLNDQLAQWLGEKNVADVLAQSAPGNVTSEMGLALLGVADAIRPHAEVVAFLEDATDDGFLDELPRLPGGAAARHAIRAYLARYGVRCVGEIDITRPRWAEHPVALVPAILSNVRNFGPGAGEQRFEQGRREAEAKAAEVLERLRALPDGDAKADETAAAIDRLRTFSGYREYPKFGIVSRYFAYKQAIVEEIDRLVAEGVLSTRDDGFFLRFDELHAAALTGTVDRARIEARRAAHQAYARLVPPRVLTSEGEAIVGTYGREDVPDGALAGLAVSSGTVSGRARVAFDIEDAALEPGDILVTPFTDPSWTPVFVTIAGLVTEVGGLTTHGAVIAREYGLPAVVGVQRATELIADGQQIRVHGTEGYVEVLA